VTGVYCLLAAYSILLDRQCSGALPPPAVIPTPKTSSRGATGRGGHCSPFLPTHLLRLRYTNLYFSPAAIHNTPSKISANAGHNHLPACHPSSYRLVCLARATAFIRGHAQLKLVAGASLFCFSFSSFFRIPEARARVFSTEAEVALLRVTLGKVWVLAYLRAKGAGRTQKLEFGVCRN
jgi:hypothetical protein